MPIRVRRSCDGGFKTEPGLAGTRSRRVTRIVLLARVLQQPEVVVAGRAHGPVALREQDELLAVGHQQVARLADHLGVESCPSEYRSVEGVDLLADRRGEAADRERHLHVVEPHRRLPPRRSFNRTFWPKRSGMSRPTASTPVPGSPAGSAAAGPQ